MNKKVIHNMAVTALMTAVICVISPFVLPIGIVPISLSSFAIYLSASLLGEKRGTVSVILYLIIGMAGLPVFSGFGSGIGKLAGPTGGYLIGYIFCAFIIGAAVDRFGDKFFIIPLSAAVGTVVLYAFGTAWFMIQSGNTLVASLGFCVLPFIPGDIAKIAAVSGIVYPLRRVIKKNGFI